VTPAAASKRPSKFDTKTFLSSVNGGRRIDVFPKKKTAFGQGDKDDSVFYIQQGKVKRTVVAANGKEATIGILNEGDFFGEGCLTAQVLLGQCLPTQTSSLERKTGSSASWPPPTYGYLTAEATALR
jgi:CRP-like cAMP-binding protein